MPARPVPRGGGPAVARAPWASAPCSRSGAVG